MGDSSIDSNRRTMIKIAIVVCLAAIAAAEADADAWYQPYNSWNNMYGYNWPMRSGYRQMNYMNGHEGHRFQSYGKREAEADADAWYQPYGYSNWNNNWMGYGNNWPMMSGYRQMNYMNGYEGHRFQSYGKREAEADAEAEPKADAEAEAYHPYGNWGYNFPMNYNMYYNNWNRPSYTQYRTFYHKRSADAEADADAWYQPYGYSSSNWGYNRMNGYNMMGYWNRPYSQFSSYRYHF